MARLTKEQRRELANIHDENESDIVAAIRDFASCILRLDEEVASEDGHEATIGRLSEDLRAARAARADLFSALSRVEASRDEARTMLGQLQSAYSAAVSVVVKTGHHRTTPVLAEAVSLIVAERDEARSHHASASFARDEARAKLAEAERQRDEALAVRANREATIEDLSEALARAIDERDEVLGKLVEAERYSAKVAAELVDQNFAIECERDEAIVKLVKVERERDEANTMRRNMNTRSRTMKTKKAERAVLVTTSYRGVFFGYATSTDGETIKLRAARNCVYWPREQKGFLGLATAGPLSGARIGPAADIELRGITCVAECTPEAVAAWERAPWS